MSLEYALRLTEVLVALALIQQSAEDLANGAWPHLPRLLLSGLLIADIQQEMAIWGLLGTQLWLLHRYRGPYNGGSDKMALLILTVLAAIHAAPGPFWQEMALAYLAVQLTLSYFVSGWVKLRHPDWRRGTALQDVFRFSAYPVSESMRGWARRPRLMMTGSWAVIALEVAFPLSLLHPASLMAALLLTAGFHLANAICFGLHRFLWIWLAAYPALIWLQGRAVAPLLGG